MGRELSPLACSGWSKRPLMLQMSCNEGCLWSLHGLGTGVMEGGDEQVPSRVTCFGKS